MTYSGQYSGRLKVGDTIIYFLERRRKWWQLTRPKFEYVPHNLLVEVVVPMDDGCLYWGRYVINTLVVIGWMGGKIAYLNVPKRLAHERYIAARPEAAEYTAEELEAMTTVIVFEEEFEVYDAWAKDNA